MTPALIFCLSDLTGLPYELCSNLTPTWFALPCGLLVVPSDVGMDGWMRTCKNYDPGLTSGGVQQLARAISSDGNEMK